MEAIKDIIFSTRIIYLLNAAITKWTLKLSNIFGVLRDNPASHRNNAKYEKGT